MRQVSTTRVMLAMLLAAGLVAAFWFLALAPKRDEAKKLGDRVSKVEASLASHESEVQAGREARKDFPVDYQQLVVLGKAVPAEDDTASLMVELSRISEKTKVQFHDIKLSSEGEGEAPPAPASTEAASPTEVAASMLPLGAKIGPGELGVMPYNLKFRGKFFHLADFLRELDNLVKTHNANVSVDGRLLTVDGFSLSADQQLHFPNLVGTFKVTTFLTPPSQGLTGGASPTAPATTTVTPASTTTGGTP